MERITVLLAEDHVIVREALRALLELEDDMEVIGEAENGQQAVELTRKLSPDVVVMDIAMPSLNGMEATRQILQAQPATKVLILSAHNDDAYVSLVMAIGASGYLVKQTAADILPKAIREIHRGSTFFSPTISSRRQYHQQKALERDELQAKKNAVQLTSPEMEVLQLIAAGRTSKETAEELHISIKAVTKQRQSLMDKLNIHDTAASSGTPLP